LAARLKVFVTSDGLTDFVVATSSKAKALAAWGVHQDVFKTGQAHETDDPQLVSEASARPGEVLRRPAAARGELAKLVTLARTKPPPRASGPSRAALKKIADLERRLAELDRSLQAERADLAAQRAELDRREAALSARHAADRERLEAQLKAAKSAPG
jgi:hypothetical protein